MAYTLFNQGEYNTTPPTLTNGQVSPIQLDASGNQLVVLATSPTVTVSSISGSVAVTGTFWQATQPVSSTQLPAALDGGGNFKIRALTSSDQITIANSSIVVTGAFYQTTQPVSIVAGTAVIGSVKLTDGTSLMGTMANFGTSPGAVESLNVNASLFSGTTALTNTGGSLNVNITGGGGGGGGGTQYAAGTTVPTPTGTVAMGMFGTTVKAFLSDTNGNQTMALSTWGGTALGAAANFGTTPGAVVAASVNASLFIGTTAAVASSSGVQKVGIAGGAAGAAIDAPITAGTAPVNGIAVLGVYNSSLPTLSTGNSAAIQVDAKGQQLIDLNYVAGSAVSTSATGVMKVGITGVSAATLDGTVGANTAPTNGLLTLGVYNSSLPTLTTGQSAGIQVDSKGQTLVNLNYVGGTAISQYSGIQNVTDVPNTSGGWSTNVQQALSASVVTVKAAAGQLGGYFILNPNSSVAYVFWYNTSSPTVGSTTNLIYQMGIPAGAAANVEFGKGIPFSTGIYMAASSSISSGTNPVTGLLITTLYK